MGACGGGAASTLCVRACVPHPQQARSSWVRSRRRGPRAAVRTLTQEREGGRWGRGRRQGGGPCVRRRARSMLAAAAAAAAAAMTCWCIAAVAGWWWCARRASLGRAGRAMPARAPGAEARRRINTCLNLLFYFRVLQCIYVCDIDVAADVPSNTCTLSTNFRIIFKIGVDYTDRNNTSRLF